MQTKFIILHQIGNNPEPVWWCENRPVLYDTRKDAEKELLQDFQSTLGQQIEEYENGERDFDQIDTDSDEWIEECTLYEDGRIALKDDSDFYNPETWVR